MCPHRATVNLLQLQIEAQEHETRTPAKPDWIHTTADAGEQLLTLRKAFKRGAELHYKAKGHHKFLLECISNGIILIGLQLKIPCMAAANSRTNIIHQFKHISSEGERLLLEALTEHYEVIFKSISEEVEEIINNMTSILDTTDGPTTLAPALMKLTEADILKKKATRGTPKE